MKVKVFEFYKSEKLEEAINNFLKSNKSEIIDIKYTVSHHPLWYESLAQGKFVQEGDEPIFSAMIIYKEE